MLTIYNSLTGEKAPFVPLVPGKIGFYVCGNTVYDHSHLGHGRSMVCTDVIIRYLRHCGFDVTFVRNITDIDDKIIQRANEKGVSIEKLTSHFIDEMHGEIKQLGMLSPDIEPRATQYIAEIQTMIQSLLDKGYAYLSDDGDVCFEVSKYQTYGKLSNKDIDKLLSGARVDVVASKRSPLDFVLWKRAKPDEPAWPSPWGEGRPGWHIECSAMATKELGDHFDIHAGGMDLKFPHHENEIAQSEAATGKPFANHWIHFGLLQVNEEKMSKSLGNFFTLSDVLSQFNPEIIRYFLLSSHYRSPLNYSKDTIEYSQKALTRLYNCLKEVPPVDAKVDEKWLADFNTAMDDDFNTPEALAVLFQLSHEVNRLKSGQLANTLKYLAGIFGLLQQDPAQFLQAGVSSDDKEAIDNLILERLQAKQEKNYQKADTIRDQLTAMGVILEDTPNGTEWRKA
ncbi:cysteine--tRNA ligase [Legionella sp. W05-934-2]|uniref:cysteine--tRNA ligase n=1 Tax=Legionella sp. W05-934-2 TaxID=1198649 RepID=UPI003461E421